MKNFGLFIFYRQWHPRDRCVQSVLNLTIRKTNVLETLFHGNRITYPTCRNPDGVPTGVQGLSKNFALLELVNPAPKEQAGNTENTGTHECEACTEKHPATFFCLVCKENMCVTAAECHKRSKISRDHRVVTVEELKANPRLASISVLCEEHNDQFRFFDEDCGRVICGDCCALNHCGHKCVIVAEAASKYRQEMEALVTKASSQVEETKAAEAQVRGASVSMKKACKESNDEIQEFFQQVRHVFVMISNEIEAAKISWDYKNHVRLSNGQKMKTVFSGSDLDKK